MAMLPAIGMIATVVGAGVSAMGAIEQGQAAQNVANYQSAVAKINADVMERNAQIAETQGNIDAQMKAKQSYAEERRIAAVFGASNLDPTSGSPLGVIQSQHEIGQFQQASAREDAALKAYNFRVQGTGATAQAAVDVAQGQQQALGGMYGGIGAGLTGAASVSDKWYRYFGSGGTGTGQSMVG